MKPNKLVISLLFICFVLFTNKINSKQFKGQNQKLEAIVNASSSQPDLKVNSAPTQKLNSQINTQIKENLSTNEKQDKNQLQYQIKKINPSSNNVIKRSWGEKIKESFANCVIGILLFIFSFPLLWLNERRSVMTEEYIKDGLTKCKSIQSDQVDVNMDGSLVHVTGVTKSGQLLSDQDFLLQRNGSVKIRKVVEMLQYQKRQDRRTETDTFGGGETEYVETYYTKVWSTNQIDNDDVQYKNPNSWIFQGTVQKSQQVKLGAFELSLDQIDQLNDWKEIKDLDKILDKGQIFNIIKERSQEIKQKYNNIEINNYQIILSQANEHQVGDMRISFQEVKQGPVTIVAQQHGNSFCPYVIRGRDGGRKNNNDPEKNQLLHHDEEVQELTGGGSCPCCVCCSCVCATANCMMQSPNEYNWIQEKTMTKFQIFDQQMGNNNFSTNLFRFVGWLLMVLGIFLFFSPIYQILQILPGLATLGKAIVIIFALLISTLFSALIIGLAWLFYRPLIGVPVVLITLSLIILTSLQFKNAPQASTVF